MLPLALKRVCGMVGAGRGGASCLAPALWLFFYGILAQHLANITR